jgi:hypothetical protein
MSIYITITIIPNLITAVPAFRHPLTTSVFYKNEKDKNQNQNYKKGRYIKSPIIRLRYIKAQIAEPSFIIRAQNNFAALKFCIEA